MLAIQESMREKKRERERDREKERERERQLYIIDCHKRTDAQRCVALQNKKKHYLGNFGPSN